MPLLFGFASARISSRLSAQTFFSRAGEEALRIACVVVLAIACCAGTPLAAQTAHAGGTLPIGSGFNNPWGVAVDGSGNVFVADAGNNLVKEIVAVSGVVSSSSTVKTIGSGFNNPWGVAVDGSGNVFVADAGNNLVKEIVAVSGVVSSSSTVKTIGSGFNLPQGVAIDGNGNVFVANYGDSAVEEIVAIGGVVSSSSTVKTIGSGFTNPGGVAVDGSGNVFVVDYGDSAVKEIVAVGGVVSSSSTVNAIGSGFANPGGVAVDGSGNVFVADYGNSAVKEIMAVDGVVPSSSTVKTIGGGFFNPVGVAVDRSGNVFVADTYNNAVKEIVLAPQKLPATAVGSTSVSLSVPFTFDSGGSIAVPIVLTQGATGLDFADAGTGTCTTNSTSHTYNTGDICTVDVTFTPKYPGQRRGAVQLVTTGGAVIATAYIYGTGTAPQVTFTPGTASVVGTGGAIINNPYQVALDDAGNMYVGDYTGKNVTKIAAGGGSASVLSLGTPGGVAIQNITGVAFDSAGNLFIGDHENSRILVMTPGGAVSVLNISGLSPSLGFPTALAFDSYGNLYIADFTNGCIVEVSSLAVAGSTSSGVGTVIGTGSYPFTGSTLTGLAVDAQRTVYAAARTQNNSSIVQVTAAGIASLVNTGGLTLNDPQGVSVDAMGNLYIVDSGNSRIVKITTTGIASVVDITGLANPSTLSNLTFGVTVDPAGNLYIPDWTNNRIVEVNTSTSPALTFSAAVVGATGGPQTVTLRNNGNADLSFPIPGSGNNPSISTNFSLDSTSGDTCPLTGSTSSAPGTLAAGATCTLPISFAPTVVGAISGSLVLTDNHLNATPGTTQTIALGGTGLQPLIATQVIVSTMLAENYAATSFTPVTGSGGTAPLSYSISPSLPTGLVLSTTTGAITGTPAAASPNTTYTVTVTDANSTTATASFSMTIRGTVTATQMVPSMVLTENTATASFTPVTGSGGVGTLSYSVSPALPAGLILSTTTGAITGTPAVSSANTSYAVTIADANNATATASFSLTVVSAPAITFTVPNHTYGDVPFNVSATSNSTGAFTYSVISGPATISGATLTIMGAGPVVLSVSQAAAGNFTAATQQASFNVANASLSVTASNATRAYGSANPNFTGSVSGAQYSDSFTETFTTAATTTTPAGGYAIVPSPSGPNMGNYTVAITNGTLSIMQAGTTTSLTASSASAAANQSVTLTATVAPSTSGTPTGTVTILDNGTALQAITLASGTTSYTATLAPGVTHTLTASYAGDTNFLSSVSAGTGTAVTVAPQDFTFSGAGNPSSQTVIPGNAVSFTFNVAPANGNSSYPGTLSLTASGCPPDATCTFSQSSFAANAGAQTVKLTVQTAPITARSREGHTPWSLALFLLPLAGARRLRSSSQRLRRLLLLATLIVGGGAALSCLTGCGSNNGFLAQQSQNYTITVTAVSGAMQHASTVTLNVQ